MRITWLKDLDLGSCTLLPGAFYALLRCYRYGWVISLLVSRTCQCQSTMTHNHSTVAHSLDAKRLMLPYKDTRNWTKRWVVSVKPRNTVYYWQISRIKHFFKVSQLSLYKSIHIQITARDNSKCCSGKYGKSKNAMLSNVGLAIMRGKVILRTR